MSTEFLNQKISVHKCPLVVLLLCAASVVHAEEKFTEADRLFTLKVGPLLSEKCNGCHGDDPEKIKGGYNTLTRESLLAGGDEFGKDVLVPGDAKKSFLLETIKWADSRLGDAAEEKLIASHPNKSRRSKNGSMPERPGRAKKSKSPFAKRRRKRK